MDAEDPEDGGLAWHGDARLVQKMEWLFAGLPPPQLRATRMTAEAFYSVTPAVAAEGMAAALAEVARMRGNDAQGQTVVDCTACVGGDTLALARAGFRVVAIERNPENHALLTANLRTWGVTDTVRPVVGDAWGVLPALEPEPLGLVVDPPWGGPDYRTHDRLRLLLGERPVEAFAAEAFALHPGLAAVVVKLPGNYDLAHFRAGIGRLRAVQDKVLRFTYMWVVRGDASGVARAIRSARSRAWAAHRK